LSCPAPKKERFKMDTQGNIRKLLDDEDPKPNEIRLEKEPDPNCKDCYGRGFIRYIIENVVEIKPCHCTKK